MYFTSIKPITRRPLGFYHTHASTTAVQNKPSYNVKHNNNGWNLEIALPGFSKDEIQIDTKQDQLTIKAVPSATGESDKATRTYHKEFNMNEKSIQFHLNEKMDSSAIQAKLENGILDIHIPSKTPAEPAAVRIEVK